MLNSEEMLRRTIAKFVDNEIIPVANDLDEKETFPRDLFKRLAGMGLYSIRYPKEAGGSAADNTHFCIMCEELARGSMSVAAFTAMQCLMGTDFLFKYGTPELRERYWRPAMRGEKVAAFCLTEPGGGTDLAAVTTTARKSADDVVITGYKTWVTNGPVADFYTVLCQTDRSKGPKGFGFFFVPRDTPGVVVTRKFSKMGTRATEISEVIFRDAHVPREHQFGPDGSGAALLNSKLEEIRVMTAALSLGLARAAFDASLRYANEREAFGRPIGKYQAIQMKLATMATEIEASRLMIYDCTRRMDRGIPAMKEASMAKYFASEAACRAADECTRIFGAYAYSNEYPASRFYRDTRFLLYGGGTSEILQVIIAKELGL
ncbi:MAG: acyl-CoA dehydrogenase [Euryarchaeota archaeon]|nr:acyl-CoA dehydrogenase [Euryarchaeota archaeon]